LGLPIQQFDFSKIGGTYSERGIEHNEYMSAERREHQHFWHD
jgi:hypothetical protein